MSYVFRGNHYLASFKGCSLEHLSDIDTLREKVLGAIQACGASILSYNEQVFHNGGYTLLVLLSESHCSIHTYPEHCSIFMDLFTCGDRCEAMVFHREMCAYLRPTETGDYVVMTRQ